MYEQDLQDLAAALGYPRGDAPTDNLRLALTTKNEAPRVGENNERLEFLGDAVLRMLVAEHYYMADPNANEGALTKKRTRIEQGTTLRRVAAMLRLGPLLRNGGRKPTDAELENAVEALIGAMFLDLGMIAPHQFVQKLIAKVESNVGGLGEATTEARSDPKGVLQRHTQQGGGSLPKYQRIGSEGPDHAPVITVEVTTPDGRFARGQGASTKAAEVEAAYQMLRQLGLA